jgi:pSer/pThr/pTyr-binding forkhead associated (FHA) protein
MRELERMYYLEVETPDGIRRIQLTRDQLSIGRLSYNDVVLPSAQISRQHAAMRLINGEWWIADLHSTNGLHLSAERIQEHRLAPGDCIVLAPGINIRFLSDTTPSPATDRPAPPLRRASAANATRDAPPQVPPSRLSTTTNRPTERPRGDSASGQAMLPGDEGSPAPPDSARPSSTPPIPFSRTASASGSDTPIAGQAHRLLHVCQTCGQLTAPDAVFCTSCHHSIAYECATCHLSLLPIQERCPRCQSPNPGSVRRAHRHIAF